MSGTPSRHKSGSGHEVPDKQGRMTQAQAACSGKRMDSNSSQHCNLHMNRMSNLFLLIVQQKLALLRRRSKGLPQAG